MVLHPSFGNQQRGSIPTPSTIKYIAGQYNSSTGAFEAHDEGAEPSLAATDFHFLPLLSFRYKDSYSNITCEILERANSNY